MGDVAGYASESTIRLAVSAAVGIFVARYLGPEQFGLLSYAIGVLGLVGTLALLGMPQVLVREFSTDRDWRTILSSALASQALAAVAAAGVGFLVIVISRGFERQTVMLALVMLPIPLLSLNVSVRSYLEAMGQIRRIVVTGVAATATAASLKVAALLLEAPVWVFGAFITAEAAMVSIGLLRGLGGITNWRRTRVMRRHFRPTVARRLLGESWPLLFAGIAVVVYMKADLLMLGVIAGDRETGLYAAAARLSEVWYFIPLSAAAAVRPRLARMYGAEQLTRYRASTQRFMTASVALALLVLATVLVAADQIVGFLYGVAFVPASSVLRIHILSAPFVFLGVAGSQWFIDRGMTRAVMVRSAVGAAVNVALNLALIPSYGAVGASIATLCAYALSGVLLNILGKGTRPLFRMQAQAMMLYWPRVPGGPEPQGPGDRRV